MRILSARLWVCIRLSKWWISRWKNSKTKIPSLLLHSPRLKTRRVKYRNCWWAMRWNVTLRVWLHSSMLTEWRWLRVHPQVLLHKLLHWLGTVRGMRLKMRDMGSVWRKWHKWTRRQERGWKPKRKMRMILSSTFRNFWEYINLRSMVVRRKKKVLIWDQLLLLLNLSKSY